MKSDRIRVFQTLEHDCGYYPQRRARNLVIDPLAPDIRRLYPLALGNGFRRSGGHVYRPNCAQCQACLPSRVVVRDFRPNRSQRRCLTRNDDLRLAWTDARHSDEIGALYQRYLSQRHPGGGMDDGDPEDFERFLRCDWSPTRFLCLRDPTNRLLAVAVTDVLPRALSAVYTFYDPAETARGLGTLAVLLQLEQARQQGREHLYLGYWIEGHPKMDYKRRFRPLERLLNGEWARLDTAG
ncbi:MAG: arginyltransferase [Lysobacteraceae bacterium]